MVAAARFHDYSLGNWLLIWSQAEQRGATVTRPAGYRTWQKLGRQVRRGERGYRILAPMTRRLPGEDAETEEPKRIVTGFRVVSVFDVSQTDGEPLADIGPSLLTGHGDADLAQAAVGLIEEQGYEFSLGSPRRAQRSHPSDDQRGRGRGEPRRSTAHQDDGARGGPRPHALERE